MYHPSLAAIAAAWAGFTPASSANDRQRATASRTSPMIFQAEEDNPELFEAILDLIEQTAEDKAILEIELSDPHEEIRFPKMLHLLREVTDDIAYKNATLAKMI